MDTNQPDVLTDVINQNQKRRKYLLPRWIKIFTWFFLIIGFLTPLAIIAGFLRVPVSFSYNSFATTDPFSLMGLIFITVLLLKGVVAFGLLKEKNWAVNLAIIDATAGIVLSLSLFTYVVLNGDPLSSNLPFDLIALIPYLIRMLKIRTEWESISPIQIA